MQRLDGTIAPASGADLKLAALLAVAALTLGACATAPPPTFPISTVPAQTTARAPTAPVRAKPAKPETSVAKAKAKADAALAEAADDDALPAPARRRLSSRYKIGAPYKINGRWYRPAENPDYDRIGVASWYGADFHGKTTANGERFDMETVSAAHTTLPLPSIVEVTNLENGRSIRVRLNDRGPYRGGRIIDLSRNAAEQLGFRNKGLARVRVRYVGPARFDGSATPLYVANSERRRDTAKLQLASATGKASTRAAKDTLYRQAGSDEAAPKLVTIAYKRPPNLDEWMRAGVKQPPLW